MRDVPTLASSVVRTPPGSTAPVMNLVRLYLRALRFLGPESRRGWILFQTSLLHFYGHYFEGLTTKGLWGARSR